MAIEAAVDWFIETRRTESERILFDLTEKIEAYAGLLQLDPAIALPKTTSLLTQLGRVDRVVLRVMDRTAPIVRDGFAGMRLGKAIYLPQDLEVRATDANLQAIVAHELSHDAFDLVRKHLHRRVPGITEGEVLWLDVRLETRAHVGAMRRLALAGLRPKCVLDYVRGPNANQYNVEQMLHLTRTAEGAFNDLTLAIGIAERLR